MYLLPNVWLFSFIGGLLRTHLDIPLKFGDDTPIEGVLSSKIK